MVKRIIFDIDNTLIMCKAEYDKAVNKALDEIKYLKTKDLCKKINDTESLYEEGRKKFDKKELIDYLNLKLKLNLPEKFMDIWLKNVEKYCASNTFSKEDYNTLEYLSSKYELVVLTNWFIECQKKRLEKIGILKFFKHFYGAEKYAKPFKESFEQASGGHNMNELAMVGDSIESDIKGALNAGIGKVVWRDINNKFEEKKEELKGVYVIHELSELKDIF